MKGRVHKIGNWSGVKRAIYALHPEMYKARQLFLMRWGLKAEGTAKQHISAQDLGWQPLAPATLAGKIRKGQSTNILVATSDYFNSITSYVKGDTAYAGVKKEAVYEEGESIANIAKIQEYGTRDGRIPSRELWRPTLEETMEWANSGNSPVDILKSRMRNYGLKAL